jgi:hypothetical protein
MSLYGGSLVRITAEERDGTRQFAYITPEMYPQAANAPGSPGLLVSDHQPLLEGLRATFYRTRPSPAVYRYLGDYRFANAGPLSKEDFSRQKLPVCDV